MTSNKKYSSEQVLSMIYALGKDFFAAATFKGLWDESILPFQEVETKQTLLWKKNLVFHM